MKEPPIVPHECPRLAGPLLTAATLLVLATVCFARLVADPAGLVVDGHRPSVDYANRGDPRPVGNDLVFLFLPHHESDRPADRRVRPLAGVGCAGVRGASAGRQPAGRDVLSARLARLVAAGRRRPSAG